RRSVESGRLRSGGTPTHDARTCKIRFELRRLPASTRVQDAVGPTRRHRPRSGFLVHVRGRGEQPVDPLIFDRNASRSRRRALLLEEVAGPAGTRFRSHWTSSNARSLAAIGFTSFVRDCRVRCSRSDWSVAPLFPAPLRGGDVFTHAGE